MTHEERMKKMAEYTREEKRDFVCLFFFLSLFVAFIAWLNVDAVLWYLGK